MDFTIDGLHVKALLVGGESYRVYCNGVYVGRITGTAMGCNATMIDGTKKRFTYNDSAAWWLASRSGVVAESITA